MSATLSPRRWRAIRAVQRWCENGGDLKGAPLDHIETLVSDVSDFLKRDLDIGEVQRNCEQAVATWLADEAKKKADEAARAEYLAKRAADYRIQNGEE